MKWSRGMHVYHRFLTFSRPTVCFGTYRLCDLNNIMMFIYTYYFICKHYFKKNDSPIFMRLYGIKHLPMRNMKEHKIFREAILRWIQCPCEQFVACHVQIIFWMFLLCSNCIKSCSKVRLHPLSKAKHPIRYFFK